MPYQANFSIVSPAGEVVFSTSDELQGDSFSRRDLEVANGATNQQVVLSGNLSTRCKAFVIESTQAINIKFDDSALPTASFSLAANTPYIFVRQYGAVITAQGWFDASAAAFSDLFITNASGAAATVTIIQLEDA